MTCKIIKETVEQVSNIKDISTRRKPRYIADCRVVYGQLCLVFDKELCKPSLKYVGSHIDRDHATILHYRKVFDGCYKTPNFSASDVYDEALQALQVLYLLIEKPNGKIIDLVTLERVKRYYRIKHIAHQEKTRSVINSLYHKLSLYRKNDFVKKCVTLSDKDIAELEFKFDAFFKVKQKLKNRDRVK